MDLADILKKHPEIVEMGGKAEDGDMILLPLTRGEAELLQQAAMLAGITMITDPAFTKDDEVWEKAAEASLELAGLYARLGQAL